MHHHKSVLKHKNTPELQEPQKVIMASITGDITHNTNVCSNNNITLIKAEHRKGQYLWELFKRLTFSKRGEKLYKRET